MSNLETYKTENRAKFYYMNLTWLLEFLASKLGHVRYISIVKLT